MHRSLLGTILALSVLSACGTSEYDWQQSYAANTLAAYQTFLKNHPKSKQADLARGMILAMQDDEAWKSAAAARSKQGYEAYLAAYPGGVHANQARFDITALDRAAAWKSEEHNADYASLHAFLEKYPQGPESTMARDRLAGMTYRALFADSNSGAGAERQRARLEVRLRAILHTLEVLPPSITGKHYEVTSGFLSLVEARAACAAAAHERQHCEVVSRQLPMGEEGKKLLQWPHDLRDPPKLARVSHAIQGNPQPPRFVTAALAAPRSLRRCNSLGPSWALPAAMTPTFAV